MVRSLFHKHEPLNCFPAATRTMRVSAMLINYIIHVTAMDYTHA